MSFDGSSLLGRASETAIVDKAVQTAHDGGSIALVLWGEAGIGKSVLLEHGVAAAREALLRVVRVTGFETEADLAYGGLQALLRPLLDGAGDLPAPQRDALHVALGLADGPAPDRLLVGLATLTLFTDAAAGSGLFCAVDDAQWLDRETQDVIGFVGRRLLSDGIALLVAVRDEARPAQLAGFQELALAGLDDEPAAQLLKRTADRIDDGIARSLVASTGANPLALIELATELSDEQRTGETPLPDPLPLGERLESVYRRRIRSLPAKTQLLLLLTAAEASGDAALLRRAAQSLDLDPGDGQPAEDAGLIDMTQGPRFRHPLIRSAVYHTSPAADRRAVHHALAQTDDVIERRAWNLAAATPGPDEGVAAQLEAAAEVARTRGGYAASLRLLTRAAELTVDPAQLGRRLLRAAEATFAGGSPVSAAELLSQAAARATEPVDRAMVLRLQAVASAVSGRPHESFGFVLEASRIVRDVAPRLSRDTALGYLEVAFNFSPGDLPDAAREARLLPPAGPPTALDHLIDGYAARVLDGLHAATPAYQRACDELLHAPEPLDLHGFYLASLAAIECWDLDRARAVTRRWVEGCRRRGAISLLPLAMAVQASVELLYGRFDDFHTLTAEAVELSNAGTGFLGRTGHAPELLLAWTGPENEARDAVERHLREFPPRSYSASVAHSALIRLELGLGNYPAALALALQLAESHTIGPTTSWNPADLAEAAHRSGDSETARRAHEQLAEAADGTPTAQGLLARVAALVADPAGADDRYREAVAHLDQSPAVLELARTHLLYGEWLRRRRRRRDARSSLRAAYDIFDDLGAHIFARRARIELAAAGEEVPLRPARPVDHLTAQELQVAQLAAAGASNREIAGRLFLSTSTVEYHLSKAFRKLGITGRGRLHGALNDR